MACTPTNEGEYHRANADRQDFNIYWNQPHKPHFKEEVCEDSSLRKNHISVKCFVDSEQPTEKTRVMAGYEQTFSERDPIDQGYDTGIPRSSPTSSGDSTSPPPYPMQDLQNAYENMNISGVYHEVTFSILILNRNRAKNISTTNFVVQVY